jgi:Domain of unknown function (DUF1906)
MAYAGFDRCDCPDLEQMQDLFDRSNLTFCGFYLPAPSQPGTTWIGKREALVNIGFGIAPLYVGQQITGPGAHNTDAEHGYTDGLDAVADMINEGFPPDSFIYLDLENGPPFTPEQQDYVGAWVDTVEDNGFRAGVYCSYLFGGEVKALRPSARIWVFHVPTTAVHDLAGTQFSEKSPSGSGYSGADIWQHDNMVQLTDFGSLLVDLNTSHYRDPGAPVSTLSTEEIVAGVLTGGKADLVAWVQTFLNDHGADIVVDGIMGPQTMMAMITYLVGSA